jgi:hypothetical protein
MICKSKQAASLVNCCIIMVFETVESIDIPPPLIRPVLLAVIPLPPATITDETPFLSQYQATTIDL